MKLIYSLMLPVHFYILEFRLSPEEEMENTSNFSLQYENLSNIEIIWILKFQSNPANNKSGMSVYRGTSFIPSTICVLSKYFMFS